MLKTLRKIFLLLVCFFAFQNFVAYAQETQLPSSDRQQTAGSYEVMLQLVVANNAAERESLPQNLVSVERKLKSDFGASNYRLALTLLTRASEQGAVELKGIGLLDKSQSNELNSFYEVTLSNIKASKLDQQELGMESLRFGLRMPVKTSVIQNEKGNQPVINYEFVGITARPLNVTLDKPTIVGTLTTLQPNEFIVVVLTVKAENYKTKQIARKNN